MTIQYLLLLLGIILLAIFLRFWRLKERGLLFWDDGVRMREVVFLDELVSFMRKNFKRLCSKEISRQECKEQFEKLNGRFLFDINPLNIFLYWLTSKVTRNIEYSGLVTNALLGLVSVIGTFFLGNLLFGFKVGLLASLALALSGYHLNYSRSVHAEASCGAFYVWATYFYFLSFRYSHPLVVLIAGFFVGCAFACNSRQFYIPFFFVAYELTSWYFYPIGLTFTRLILLGISMFLPLMIIEELFVLLRAVGYPYPTYFMQLFERTGQRLSMNFKFPSFKIYLKTLYSLEGIVSILILILGTIYLIKDFSYGPAVILSQCFLPILFWSARPTQSLLVRKGSIGTYQVAVPRLISSYVYAGSIVVAFGLVWFGTIFPHALIVALSIFVLNGLWQCWKIIGVRSGYKKAIEFIQKQGNISYISFCHPISDFYAKMPGEVVHFDTVSSEGDLKELYVKKNCRYLLYVKTLHKNVFKLELPYIEKILRSSLPKYSVDLGYEDFYFIYSEDTCNDEQIMLTPCRVEVYDFSAIYVPEKKSNGSSAKGVQVS